MRAIAKAESDMTDEITAYDNKVAEMQEAAKGKDI